MSPPFSGRDPVSNTLTAQESSWHVSAEDTTIGATAPIHCGTGTACASRTSPDADHDNDNRFARW